ncbi:hypothetical protein [Bosea sp. (in: a-proteobacteria)]|uniref:hypothetical protein n=1 Tax=Bosea sp. (in: a-proteobacteria) TaxID=1871050 RepID=UPI00262AFEF5|nr:hypothetical protein [Bosea sp. (in: a-proteobacteria)]MCO5090882.1 ribbon-helix-helix domain-containing protein [Bosea sp. (in: a-proteobacteria)]
MIGSKQVSVTLSPSVIAEVDKMAFARRMSGMTGKASRSAVIADAVASIIDASVQPGATEKKS